MTALQSAVEGREADESSATPPMRWIDLLDPDYEALARAWPRALHSSATDRLLRPPGHVDEPRPRFESHGDYVLGSLVVPIVVADEDRIYYQLVYLLLTRDLLVTVRLTPPDGAPFDRSSVQDACAHDHEGSAGMFAFHLVDEVAERYLELVDAIVLEIDELEEHVEDWPADRIRQRISSLRHDLLRIRQTLTPTRNAVRGIVDNRVELEGEELFPPSVEVHFGDAYDKLLRASEGIDLARDLVAGVRDYHQSKVSHDQNEVMKRLTVIASTLLVPTLIVGIYGQNLKGIPESNWQHGYWWSWSLIIGITVIQLFVFRRKRWI